MRALRAPPHCNTSFFLQSPRPLANFTEVAITVSSPPNVRLDHSVAASPAALEVLLSRQIFSSMALVLLSGVWVTSLLSGVWVTFHKKMHALQTIPSHVSLNLAQSTAAGGGGGVNGVGAGAGVGADAVEHLQQWPPPLLPLQHCE